MTNKLNIMMLDDDLHQFYDRWVIWLNSFDFLKDQIRVLKCPFLEKKSTNDQDIITFKEFIKTELPVDIAFVDIEWNKRTDYPLDSETDEETFFKDTESGWKYIVPKLENKYEGKCLIICHSNYAHSITNRPSYPLNDRNYPAISKVSNAKGDKTDLFELYLLNWHLTRIRRLNDKVKWETLLYALKDCRFEGNIKDELDREWRICDFLLVGSQVFKHIEQIKEIEGLLDYYRGPKIGTYWKDLDGEHWKAYHKLLKKEFDENSKTIKTYSSKNGFKIYNSVEVKVLAWWAIIEKIIVLKEDVNIGTIRWLASSNKIDENSLIIKLAWRLLTLKLFTDKYDIDAINQSGMFQLRDLRCLCLLHDKVTTKDLPEYIKKLNADRLEALSSKTRKLFNTHLGFSCPNNTLAKPNDDELFPHEIEFLNSIQ